MAVSVITNRRIDGLAIGITTNDDEPPGVIGAEDRRPERDQRLAPRLAARLRALLAGDLHRDSAPGHEELGLDERLGHGHRFVGQDRGHGGVDQAARSRLL